MTGAITRREALGLLRRPMWLGGRQDPLPQYRPRMAFRNAPGSPADILVCVFLRGGTDGLSLVAPYFEGADYYDGRPTIALPAPGAGAGAALELDSSFGLHPSLAPLMPFYEAGSLGIVHAAGLANANRSHFDAQRYVEQDVPDNKTIGTGWIGRHLSTTTHPRGLRVSRHRVERSRAGGPPRRHHAAGAHFAGGDRVSRAEA